MFGFADDQFVQRHEAPFCIHPAATGSFLSAAARMIAAERYAIQPTLRINFKKGP
ncbi:MAG TPA: hypothetical protein ACFCUC_13535 [Desulfobacterales bacterium]